VNIPASVVASSLLWVIAVLDVIIACAYCVEGRYPLAVAFFAFAVSQVAMAWV